jgi:hypothetical protein
MQTQVYTIDRNAMPQRMAVADTQEITEHADGKISLWFSKVSSDYKTRYVNKFVIGVRGAVTVAQLQFDDRGYAT